jgi:hypothetical protein
MFSLSTFIKLIMCLVLNCATKILTAIKFNNYLILFIDFTSCVWSRTQIKKRASLQRSCGTTRDHLIGCSGVFMLFHPYFVRNCP